MKPHQQAPGGLVWTIVWLHLLAACGSTTYRGGLEVSPTPPPPSPTQVSVDPESDDATAVIVMPPKEDDLPPQAAEETHNNGTIDPVPPATGTADDTLTAWDLRFAQAVSNTPNDIVQIDSFDLLSGQKAPGDDPTEDAMRSIHKTLYEQDLGPPRSVTLEVLGDDGDEETPTFALTIEATSRILTDTLRLASYPEGSLEALLAASRQVRTDGTALTLTSKVALPQGIYRVEFYEYDQTRTIVPAPSDLQPGNPFTCVVPQEVTTWTWSREHARFAVEPTSATRTCTFDSESHTIRFEGRVPKDPATGKRTLRLLYLGARTPPRFCVALSQTPKLPASLHAWSGPIQDELPLNSSCLVAGPTPTSICIEDCRLIAGERLVLGYVVKPPETPPAP